MARSRRRGRVLLVLVAAALIIGVWGLAAMQQEDNPFASPETVELPDLPDDSAPTVYFLASPEGQLVPALLDATAPLLADQPDVEGCRRTVDRLDRVGTPDELLVASARVPDQSTSDMVLNHVHALARFLGTCLEEGAAPPVDEVRFTSVVLQRRLDSLR